MMSRCLSLATLCCLAAALGVVACAPPTIPDDAAAPSDGLTEESGDDDSPPLARHVDAGVAPDAAPKRADAGAADAAPTLHTLTVGSRDCNGGHCRAGYDGTKDVGELVTASKQCADRGFARATEFTFSTDNPGGKFCSWKNGAYGCDSSCSGCNPIETITCASP